MNPRDNWPMTFKERTRLEYADDQICGPREEEDYFRLAAEIARKEAGKSMKDKILSQMQDAETKAWEALSGYKFWMFGYHAGRWVNYNNLLEKEDRFQNPFIDAVKMARSKNDELNNQLKLNLENQ